MKDIIKLICTCVIIIIWGFAIHGTIEAHGNAPTVSHDSPMMLDEIVELKTPTYKVPEIPAVRLITFVDEFAPDPLIASLNSLEWAELESIGIAEAGNQGVEGVSYVMLVVLNRVRKNGLSVHSTIYAPNQFYTAGMRGGNDLSRQARELIQSGWDESQGAIYFQRYCYSPYGTENLFQYGDHYFSK